jgi:cell division protein FtsN
MAASDDDAPWLAEAAPQAPAPGRRPLLNIVIIVLAAGTVIALALVMLLGRRDAGSSEGYMEAAQAPLIEADPGPFKVPPADRQGLEVEGVGEVIHGAVRGENIESQIDMSALPEEPMGRPRDLLPPGTPPATATTVPGDQPVPVQVVPTGPAPTRTEPARPAPQRPAVAASSAPTGAAKPVTPVAKPAPIAIKPAVAPAAPKPAAAGNTLVQIGAFSSEAKAEEEWARVSGKGGLTGKRIEKLTNSSGKTLWRVRGLAADPAAACAAITAARGACEVVRK